MSRFTTVKQHAKHQEEKEPSTVLPQELYLDLCKAWGDAFGFARVRAFGDKIDIPFWKWFNYLEDDLCLVLKN